MTCFGGKANGLDLGGTLGPGAPGGVASVTRCDSDLPADWRMGDFSGNNDISLAAWPIAVLNEIFTLSSNNQSIY